MSITTDTSPVVRVIGIVTVVAGVVMLVAGAITWSQVSSHLAAENITVSEDAAHFGGQAVTNPWTAYYQADIIAEHTLKATDGKTYAELDKEDPLRQVAMTGSFLRASLFTSVVAFGVAALTMGIGVLFGLVGSALTMLGARRRPTPTIAASSPLAVATA